MAQSNPTIVESLENNTLPKVKFNDLVVGQKYISYSTYANLDENPAILGTFVRSIPYNNGTIAVDFDDAIELQGPYAGQNQGLTGYRVSRNTIDEELTFHEPSVLNLNSSGGRRRMRRKSRKSRKSRNRKSHRRV